MKLPFSWPPARPVRQGLVFITYGLLVAMLIYDFFLILGMIPLPSVAWPHLLAALFFIPIFVLLELGTGRAIFTSRYRLDERQEKLRNLAFRRSYQSMLALTAVMLFSFVLLRAGAPLDLFMRHYRPLVTDSLLIFLALFLSLPTAIVAWLEPDPVSDEPGTHSAKYLA